MEITGSMASISSFMLLGNFMGELVCMQLHSHSSFSKSIFRACIKYKLFWFILPLLYAFRYHSAKLDWKEAEIFASLLCEHSKWSRTIYTYQRAVVMLMRDKKDLTPDELQTIENLMR